MKYTTLLNQLDEYLFTYTIDNKILTLKFNHITLIIKHKGIINHTYTVYCDYNYYDTPKVVGTRHTQESLATLIKFFIKFYPYEYIKTIIHNAKSSTYLYNIKDKYTVHYDYPNQKIYFIDTQTHKQVGRTTKELTLSQLYDLEMELDMKVNEADKSNIFNYGRLLEVNGYYYTTNYTYEKDFGTYTKVIKLKDHNEIIVTYKNTDSTSFTLNNYYQLGDELKMDKEKVKITLEDCKLQEVSLDIKPASCYNYKYSGTTKATIKEDNKVDKMIELLDNYGYKNVEGTEDYLLYVGMEGNQVKLSKRHNNIYVNTNTLDCKLIYLGNTIEELEEYLKNQEEELDKIKLVLSVYDYFLDFTLSTHIYFKNNKGSYVAINKNTNRIYEGTQPLLVNAKYIGNTSKDLNNYLDKQEKIKRIREAVKELGNYKEYDSNKAYLSFVDESNQINIQYIKDNIHVFIPNTKLSVSENANVEYKEDIIEQVKELEEYLLDKSNQELTTQDMIDKLKEQGYKVIKEY